MNAWFGLTGLFLRFNSPPVKATSPGPLREFVYLDEVSVYSLLASRRTGIATEFTESQTASLNNTLGGELGVGLAGAKAGLTSTRQSSHSHASQVVRKATVQTSFKELYELERPSLAVAPCELSRVPIADSVTYLEERLQSLIDDKWVVDPSALNRGELSKLKSN